MANKKSNEQDLITSNNLLEQSSEIFEKCTSCGMCKGVCPVFSVLKEERVSPRGHGILISKKILDKAIFECNLCKACEQGCPLDIKVCEAVLKAREAMVLKGKSLEQNKDMINNVQKTGNPFGKSGKWGINGPDKLYCC